MKKSAKEVREPDYIISGATCEQKFQDMNKFLNEIGTKLRILEEVEPWSNKADIYIGLIKEAVQKYMNLIAHSTFQQHG